MSLTPEQIEQRRHLITASDAGAVLGLDPWRSPIDVWSEKVDPEHQRDAGTFRMRRGHFVEPLLLEYLGEKKAPLRVERAGGVTLVHPILTWLGATPDARVLDGEELVALGEAKSSGAVEYWTDDDGKPTVPDYYVPQVVVQMAVTKAPRTFVVAEILTERGPEAEPWIIEVERDMDLEAIVLEELDTFRRRYIETKTPPPYDPDRDLYVQVATVFRREKRVELVQASPESDRLARRYLEARAEKKKLEEELADLQARLCTAIGDDAGLHGDTWKCTWKEREATKVAYERAAYRHFDIRAVGTAADAKPRKKGRAA